MKRETKPSKENVVVELSDISLSYDTVNETVSVFNSMELRVNKKDIVGIVGPSGSGKTSLLHLIRKKIKPTKGKLIVTQKVRIIPQFSTLNPYLTCEETLMMEKRLNETDIDIKTILKTAQLEEQYNQLIFQLSGGQQQRMAVLAAIASGSTILLADEPFSRLDNKNVQRLKSFLIDSVKIHKITLILTSNYPKHFQDIPIMYKIANCALVQM